DFNVDDLADAYFQLGVAQAESGQAVAGLKACEEAVRLREPLVLKNRTNRGHRGSVALYKEWVGLLQVETDQRTAAKQVQGQGQVIKELEEVAWADRSYTTWQAFLGTAHVRLAALYRNAGEPEKARPALERALDILKVIGRTQPGNLDYRSRLAAAW